MFTGQAAETILGFFPPSLRSTKSTHMNKARENKEQSYKRTLNQKKIYLPCWEELREVGQNIRKEENTRELNKRK